MTKIRVLIADKQPAFREGLASLLAGAPDMEAVGYAGDGEELLKLAAELKPDVAIIDIALPKINGIDATKELRRISPQTAVLIVCAYQSQTLALSALRAGAASFLTKDTPTADLIRAIRLIQAGEGIIARSTGEDIIRAAANEPAQSLGLDLNPRELEVLKSAARGLRNKEIARELNISERTVQSHLSNIYNKMAVDSRTEAVLKALRDGKLDISDLR
jgi:NarL family two-component system response regulator LiaR